MSEIIISKILIAIIKNFDVYKTLKKNEPDNPFVNEFESYMFRLKEAVKEL